MVVEITLDELKEQLNKIISIGKINRLKFIYDDNANLEIKGFIKAWLFKIPYNAKLALTSNTLMDEIGISITSFNAIRLSLKSFLSKIVKNMKLPGISVNKNKILYKIPKIIELKNIRLITDENLIQVELDVDFKMIMKLLKGDK